VTEVVAPDLVSGPIGKWQHATIERIATETYRAKTFTLAVPRWGSFRPGQHVDVRLTAPDGYQAQRSYSIASAPDLSGVIELTVELVDDGEVSGWFHEVAKPRDQFELRGPIGGPFTWTVDDGGPIFLLAGGSGIVPLMSMLRHRQAQRSPAPALLLYSSRTLEDVIYRQELDALVDGARGPDVVHTLTRGQPPDWQGHSRRVDREMVGEALARIGDPLHVFICGPTTFVEATAGHVVSEGVEVDRIRTERFGPSG